MCITRGHFQASPMLPVHTIKFRVSKTFVVQLVSFKKLFNKVLHTCITTGLLFLFLFCFHLKFYEDKKTELM